jgi:hypothetical protein
MNLQILGFPTSCAERAVVIAHTDVGHIAVSVPVEWTVVDAEIDGQAGTMLQGMMDPLQAASQVEAVYDRRTERGQASEPDLVSNVQLRGEFTRRAEAGELNAYQLAARLGWTRRKEGLKVPDTDKVFDLLGLRRERNLVSYEQACQLAAGMHIDPSEVGL